MFTNLFYFFLIVSVSVLEFSLGARHIDIHQRMVNSLEKLRSRRSVDDVIPKPEEVLIIGKGETLELEEELSTYSGNIKTKYQEMYKGIPVRGEIVVIESDPSGHYTGQTYGQLLEGIEEDIPSLAPNIPLWEALEIALNWEHDLKDDIQFNPEKDGVLAIHVDESGSSDAVTPHLVWEVNYFIETTKKVSRPFYVIDASTGEIVDHWQELNEYYIPIDSSDDVVEVLESAHSRHSREVENAAKTMVEVRGFGGNEKSGKHIYGEDYPFLEVVKNGNLCYLENDHVRILNGSRNDGGTHRFDCNDGNSDEVNGAFSPLNDVYFFSNIIHDMYMEWLGNEPITGMKIQIKVHCPNARAYWDGRGFVNFGDGSSTMYPMTVLDVISHEVAHGFTQSHSELINRGQSGAMNEAFSDMAGEAAEYFFNETHDWVFGRNVSKVANGLRFLNDPPKDNHSVGHFDNFCPGLTVHYGSGIFNKAFYILSNKPGWNVRKAFETFARANMLYWTRASTFSDGACGVEEAARDRGYDVRDVTNSFLDVGVEPCTMEPRGIYKMYDLKGRAGQNVSFTWSVSADIRDVTIHVVNEDWRIRPNIDLYIKSGNYFLTSVFEYTEEKIQIKNPSPGLHQITLFSYDDFSKVSLMVVSNNITLIENLTWNSLLDSFHVNFNITHQDIHADEIFVIRAQARQYGQKPPQRMALRYQQPVNIIEGQYDFRATDYYMYRHKFIQITLCGPPRVGQYDLAISGEFVGAEVTLHRMHILNRLN